jgi:glucose/arabinose dehydrogenase
MLRSVGSLAVAAALALPGVAAAAPRFHFVTVGRFAQPVAVVSPPRDASRLLVLERRGTVRLVRRGHLQARAFLDLRGLVQIRSTDVHLDQGGLLSVAFAPDYRTSGRLYVLYTSRDDNIRLDEFRRARGTSDRAAPGSRRTLLSVPRTGGLDVAGALQFGPDRMLYVSLGFGSRPAASQNLAVLTGKLLRIDPRPAGDSPYQVPPDNPFVGRAGARPEIYAYGLRVPWRFSFDRARGGLAIGDVGQDAVEEIDFAPAGGARGANFGYPFFEGDRRALAGGDTLTPPVLTRPHGPTVCAIVGGYVVRDRGLPSLYGRYLYGDFCSGEIRSAHLALPRATGDRAAVGFYGLDSFGEDARGRIYAVSILGRVARLAQR